MDLLPLPAGAAKLVVMLLTSLQLPAGGMEVSLQPACTVSTPASPERSPQSSFSPALQPRPASFTTGAISADAALLAARLGSGRLGSGACCIAFPLKLAMQAQECLPFQAAHALSWLAE